MKEIVTEGEGESIRAVGVRLADGRVYRGKAIISNATRWDTFEYLLGKEKMPRAEQLFRCGRRKRRGRRGGGEGGEGEQGGELLPHVGRCGQGGEMGQVRGQVWGEEVIGFQMG